jgi:hypothetical protein
MGKEIERLDWGPGGEARNWITPAEEPSSDGLPVAAPGQYAAGDLAAVSIEAAVNDPGHLNAKTAGLPISLQDKMLETLRIPPMRGGAKAAESALMSRLTDEELEAYHDWVEALSADERQAIRAWFDGEYR